MMHWPNYSDRYGRAPRNVLIQDDGFSGESSANLSGRHTFTCAPKVDPMSRALAGAKAAVVDAQGFRMCGATGGLETPPAARSAKYGRFLYAASALFVPISGTWQPTWALRSEGM